MGAMLVRHEPTSASAVRRELTQDLRLHGLDDDSIDAVTLVASELLGNAVRHSGITADTELDVAIEAHTDAERQRILALRDRLLAEHLDTEPSSFAAAVRAEGALGRTGCFGVSRQHRRFPAETIPSLGTDKPPLPSGRGRGERAADFDTAP